GTDATEQHFTGKERDTESGNDFFGARYYESGLGRWLSPDWSAQVEPVPYAKIDNPQSLDLYSYVLNNPSLLADLDGHATAVATSPVLDAIDAEFNQIASAVGAARIAKARGIGAAVAVGVVIGGEVYMLLDAHAIKVKADADMRMVIAMSEND